MTHDPSHFEPRGYFRSFDSVAFIIVWHTLQRGLERHLMMQTFFEDPATVCYNIVSICDRERAGFREKHSSLIERS